ncbi:hypothetical protein BJ508DRAFT_333399 [Ascobolus immersus RN42]|uniref:Uncharacterized protein n=1 Tax=Ascobolus immersus RN42 TaxID=1160509 RepID=A0A3N4HMF6_ASCIM|nr:hypothetical protein BJ508DRAFT_333399 [Ascobolus immersus RN42]
MPPTRTSTNPSKAKRERTVAKCHYCRKDKKKCVLNDDASSCLRCIDKEFICTGVYKLDPPNSARRAIQRFPTVNSTVAASIPSHPMGPIHSSNFTVDTELLVPTASHALSDTTQPAPTSGQMLFTVPAREPTPSPPRSEVPPVSNDLSASNRTSQRAKAPETEESRARYYRLVQRGRFAGSLRSAGAKFKDRDRAIMERSTRLLLDDLERAKDLQSEGQLYEAESICRRIVDIGQRSLELQTDQVDFELCTEAQPAGLCQAYTSALLLLSDVLVRLHRYDEALSTLLGSLDWDLPYGVSGCYCDTSGWELINEKVEVLYQSKQLGFSGTGYTLHELLIETDEDDWDYDLLTPLSKSPYIFNRLLMTPTGAFDVEPLAKAALREKRLDILCCLCVVLDGRSRRELDSDSEHNIGLEIRFHKALSDCMINGNSSHREIVRGLYNRHSTRVQSGVTLTLDSLFNKKAPAKDIISLLDAFFQISSGPEAEEIGGERPGDRSVKKYYIGSIWQKIFEHDRGDILETLFNRDTTDLLSEQFWSGEIVAPLSDGCLYSTNGYTRYFGEAYRASFFDPGYRLDTLEIKMQASSASSGTYQMPNHVGLIESACLLGKPSIIGAFLRMLKDDIRMKNWKAMNRWAGNMSGVLVWSIIGGNLSILEMVLEHWKEGPQSGSSFEGHDGAFFDARLQDSNGSYTAGLSAMHLATLMGYNEAVRLLLLYGASSTLMDSKGRCPLFYALTSPKKNTSLIQLLTIDCEGIITCERVVKSAALPSGLSWPGPASWSYDPGLVETVEWRIKGLGSLCMSEVKKVASGLLELGRSGLLDERLRAMASTLDGIIEREDGNVEVTSAASTTGICPTGYGIGQWP